jgi:hypothetical protein
MCRQLYQTHTATLTKPVKPRPIRRLGPLLWKKEWARYQILRPLREEMLFYISQTTHAAEIFPL